MVFFREIIIFQYAHNGLMMKRSYSTSSGPNAFTKSVFSEDMHVRLITQRMEPLPLQLSDVSNLIFLMAGLRLHHITEIMIVPMIQRETFPLYLYVLIDFSLEDSPGLSGFQTTLVKILKCFCKIFSCVLFVSFYSSCSAVLLTVGLLLNSFFCTNLYKSPPFFLGTYWIMLKIQGQRSTTFPLTRSVSLRPLETQLLSFQCYRRT